MPSLRYLDEQEVLTIRRRLAETRLGGRDFGRIDPLRPHLLSSAISRQHVGIGKHLKHSHPISVAATLFYGIALNHAFENGNKRTALVAMLILLDRNKIVMFNTSEDDLYEVATQVANRSFQIPAGQSRDADAEVDGLVAWLNQHVRWFQKGDYDTMFVDLRRTLEAQGCFFDAPQNNFIKVHRKTSHGTLSAKLPYRRANFNVGLSEVKRVRARLALDGSHGVDSAAFYYLEETVDRFINDYRQLLDRLAET